MDKNIIKEYDDILNNDFYNELKQAVHNLVDTAFDNIIDKTCDDEYLKRCEKIRICTYLPELFSVSDVRKFIDMAYYQAVSDVVAEIKNTIDCDWIAENVIFNRKNKNN